MNRTGSSRLMVTEGNRVAGIIRLKDMMKFFELKIELEPCAAIFFCLTHLLTIGIGPRICVTRFFPVTTVSGFIIGRS